MIYDHKSINHYFVNLEAYISLVSELEFKKCKIWNQRQILFLITGIKELVNAEYKKYSKLKWNKDDNKVIEARINFTAELCKSCEAMTKFLEKTNMNGNSYYTDIQTM